MPSIIDTEIEIKAAPEKVRSVMLDFASYSTWHSPDAFSISLSDPSKKSVEKGDILEVNATGFKFKPVVLENTPSELSWNGSTPLLLSGKHYFVFETSQNPENVGGTRFVQKEVFTGLLSGLFYWYIGQKTTGQFRDFNESLKKRVESL